MVQCVFWLFSMGAPANQPAKGGGEAGVSKASQPPSRG